MSKTKDYAYELYGEDWEVVLEDYYTLRYSERS